MDRRAQCSGDHGRSGFAGVADCEDDLVTSLEESFLCVDCNTVAGNSRNCAKCQSGSLLNLASILNRKTVSREAMEVLRFIPSWKGVA